MPELPEVETVARKLAPQILNSTLQKWEVYDSRLHLPKQNKKLSGSNVTAVERLGKQIVINFNDPADNFIAVHLRMSGRLFWSSGSPRSLKEDFARYQESFAIKSKAHLRLRFVFNKGALLFVDPRRFGTVELSDSIETFIPEGIEPLSKAFTFALFEELLSNSTQPIKTWLLRQDKIVGIGNIYASEILYRAGINPERSVRSLKAKEKEKLYSAIKDILNKAVKHCGTTFSDFQSTLGETGSFQKYLAVYNREEEKCLSCSKTVARIVQGGRSTFYCKSCQR